jgi:hypothetical protein
MALDVTPLPYGLRDVKVTPYTDAAATVLGTPVDLPNSQTLSFEESEDFEELRGDDQLVATHGKGAQVAWTLDAGGLSLEAVAVMYGGTVVEGGVTPASTKTYTKYAGDQRPYFKAEGQVISDSGGDLHCILHRCKATDNLTGEFSDGAFFITEAKGTGLASNIPVTVGTETKFPIYEFVQNETVTPIVTP